MPLPTFRYAVVAAAVTVTVVGIGVGSTADSPLAREQVREQVDRPPDVPLDETRLETINATRTPFCDDIPEDAVATAVGGPATESAYGNGERTALEPGLVDVSHEFGCVFTHGQTVARVWVFASPVTRIEAQSMVREARAGEGCGRSGPLEFGSPGAVLDCYEGDLRTLRAVGRIGDAWVHCELTAPLTDPDPRFILRGQNWCVAATYAMDG